MKDWPGKVLVALKVPGVEHAAFTTHISRVRPYHAEPPTTQPHQLHEIEEEGDPEDEREEVTQSRTTHLTPVVVYQNVVPMIQDLRKGRGHSEQDLADLPEKEVDRHQQAGGAAVPLPIDTSLQSDASLWSYPGSPQEGTRMVSEGEESPQEGTRRRPPSRLEQRHVTSSGSEISVDQVQAKGNSSSDSSARRRVVGQTQNATASVPSHVKKFVANSSTDPEPLAKEARPLRQRARQITADRGLARQLEFSRDENI